MTGLRLVRPSPITEVIPPPDYVMRALLTRDGFVERWGSQLAPRPPLEIELPRAPGRLARILRRIR